MAVRLVDAITLRLVEREIEELVVYVGPNKVAESLGLWLGRPVGRGLPWRVNRRSFHTYTRCGHALQRGHEASYRTRRVRIAAWLVLRWRKTAGAEEFRTGGAGHSPTERVYVSAGRTSVA